MSYKIELTNNFKKEANRFTKKYPSLKTELAKLIDELGHDFSARRNHSVISLKANIT